MTTIGQAFSRAIITLNDNEILKQLALSCAAGLFVSLLMLSYGVDLSPGFFWPPIAATAVATRDHRTAHRS